MRHLWGLDGVAKVGWAAVLPHHEFRALTAHERNRGPVLHGITWGHRRSMINLGGLCRMAWYGMAWFGAAWCGVV